MPIVRALAPFVAGMEGMTYRQFLPISVLGAVLWVWICVLLGYAFGELPIVKDHFEHALLLLFGVMGVGLVLERVIHRKMHAAKQAKKAAEVASAESGEA